MKARIVLGPEYISCQKLRTIGLAVWPVDRSLTDRQTDKQMKATQRVGTLRNCFFFRLHHWHWLQHVNVKGQEHSQFGHKASNEKCTMDSALFRIQYHYNSQKYVTLTFDIWHWLLSLTLTLMYDLEIDLLLHWCFKEKNCQKINVWRHVTQKRYFVRDIGDNNPDRYFFKELVAPN